MSPSAHLPPLPLPLSIPSVLPSSPWPPALLPWLACIVLPLLFPVDFCLFRAGLSKILFFAKIQMENIVGFVCYTVSAATTPLAVVAQRQAKIIHQQILVPQAVVCQLFSEHGSSRHDWWNSFPDLPPTWLYFVSVNLFFLGRKFRISSKSIKSWSNFSIVTIFWR